MNYLVIICLEYYIYLYVKIKYEIVSLIPKMSQYMFGNDGEPFSLIEDFILIISADVRILKMLLVNRK